MTALNCGLQRCFVPSDVLKKYQLNWGHFCSISSSNRHVICVVRYYSKSSFSRHQIHFDDSVFVPTWTNWGNQNELIRRLIQDKTPKTVGVTLIMKTKSQVSKYQNCKWRLHFCIHATLSQFAITRHCRLKCHKIPPCSVFGIEMIIIEDLEIEENNVVVINEESKVIVKSVISQESFDQSERTHKTVLGGLNDQYKKLKNIILDLHPTTHTWLDDVNVSILLHGPSGTGKTSLVKKIASDLGVHLIHLICSDVFRSYPGESEQALKEVFHSASELCSESDRTKCVLFLDEIDSIGVLDNQATVRLNHELKRLLDDAESQPLLIVIAATNKLDELNPELKQRFGLQVLVGIPTVEQKSEILKAIIGNNQFKNIIDLHQIAESTAGYTAADLNSLWERTVNEAIKQEVPIITNDFTVQILKQFRPAHQKANADIFPDLGSVRWEDIGGLDEVKLHLRIMLVIPFTSPEVMVNYNRPSTNGLLLYGPPGCCKTTLIKAAANEAKISFLSLVPNQVYSAFLGESERKIREVFRIARACSPSILFIDELDGLVGSRTKNSPKGVSEKVLSTLLNEMDGIGVKDQDAESLANNVIVIGATNKPDLLDPALIRRGRMDAMVYIPPPDLQARKSILAVQTKDMPLKNVDLDAIAEKTNLFSGADLEQLIREAAHCAALDVGITNVKWIEHIHFEQALEEKKPSLTEQQLEFYNNFNSSEKK